MAFVPDAPEGAKASGKFVPDSDDPLSRENLEKDVTNEDIRIPGTDTRIPGTGKINQFLISTGRGMVDLWAGANQIVRTGEDAKTYTKEQEEELKLFEPMEREAPVTSTVGRVTGQVAPTLAVPFGAAARGAQALGRTAPMLSFLTRAGAGADAAIMGGLQGLMNFVPEGESRAGNAAASAASAFGVTKGLQLAGEFAGPLVRRGVNYLSEKTGVGRQGLAEMSGAKAATTVDDLSNALKSEGIDWATLPRSVREGLKQQADDAAKAGAPVTPAELARVVRAQNLPGGAAELTKGQMTQNRTQLRTEFDMRRTSAGHTLDDQLIAQDKALADSLDVIKLKTGGTTTGGREAEAGRKITSPLVQQLRKAQANVDELYSKADTAGETLQQVDPTPLVKWVEDNFAAMHSAPAMRSLVAQLKKSGLVTVSDDGVAAAGREPTVRELEELRKAMVKWGKADGSSGHYMGEAKRVLDGITDGKGGELYKAARGARISMREQFEDPGVINRLVGEKGGGDRMTDFEDVFKVSVINSSVDDLTRLRGQLLTGGEGKTHEAGVQAFKDLRAAALDYIKLGAITNADEVSHAGLKRAVDSIGREKIEVLFGKNTANQLYSVLESAKDMKAVFNKSGVYNPGTASALVEWIDRITGIVGLGKAGTYGRLYATGAAKKVMENIQQPKLVDEASKPVQAAMRAGEQAKDDAYKKLIGLYAAGAGARGASGVGAAVAMPDEE